MLPPESAFFNADFEVKTSLFSGGRGSSRLIFRPVEDSSFGSYKCSVENELGIKNQVFHLTGKLFLLKNIFNREKVIIISFIYRIIYY